MRILEFRAENYKRIKIVEITPDGNVIELRGKNRQGKSSVLDAIESALSYATSKKRVKEPIRDGEDEASIFLDLGELKVTRRFWGEGKSDVTVTDAEGQVFKSPQTVLDKLYGKLSFDPMAFAGNEKDQKGMLLSVVDLPFDLDELAAKREGLFDRRRDINRDVAALKGQLAGLPKPEKGLPDTEQSAADLVGELRGKQEIQNRRETASHTVSDAEFEIARLQDQITEAETRRDEAQKFIDETPVEDLSGYEERLATIDDLNAKIRDAARRAEIAEKFADETSKSERLTKQMDELDAKKAAALAEADMPLEGIGIDENGVTYLGKPFSQVAHAEKVRVSTAMGMALNPDLRVLRIENGESLDKDNLKILHDMAEDNDFQIWLEIVSEEEGGIVLYDGEIVGA